MDILLGYDNSPVSHAALEVALKHAKAFGAGVYVVLSMLGGTDVPEEVFIHAEEDLQRAAKRFTEDRVECETRLLVRGLEPGEDLVRFAEEKRVDEIIIGVRKKSKVGKLLFGSNARYVILNAPCPVVTVR